MALKTAGDVGEFPLIERLRRIAGMPKDERLVVGIGDDAAVWRTGSGFTVATTDTMVAGVHFLPDAIPWRDVGWKALASNISDIAAMGGEPAFALVTLCLPPATDLRAMEEIYRGMREIGEVYGVTVAGGDIVRSRTLTITVTLLGEASSDEDGRPRLLLRNAARPGDVVAVTGPLGGAAGGLAVLKRRSQKRRTKAEQALVERHGHPWPRADAGYAAVQTGIECGMDISDGLVQDLGHICRASGVDAELRADDIPLEPGLAETFGRERAVQLALTGGEDYELLLLGGERLQLAHRVLREQLGVDSLWDVGRVTGRGNGRVRVIDSVGKPLRLADGGWDHLRTKR